MAKKKKKVVQTQAQPKAPNKPAQPSKASAGRPGVEVEKKPIDFSPAGILSQYEQKQKEANAANEKRYAEGLAGYDALINQQAAANQAAQAGYQQRYGDYISALKAQQQAGQGIIGGYQGRYDDYQKALAAAQAAGNDIVGGYQSRYDTGMRNLEGAGVQEAADINAAASANSSNVLNSLRDSGLAGTTILPTLRAGVERNRIAEQARLNERLRQERAAAHANLSADVLGAKSGQQAVGLSGAQTLAGLRSDALGEQARQQIIGLQGAQNTAGLKADELIAANAGQAAQSALGVGKLGFLERRTDQAPDVGLYASMMQNMGSGGLYGAPTQTGAPPGLSPSGTIPSLTPATPAAPKPKNDSMDDLMGKYKAYVAEFQRTNYSGVSGTPGRMMTLDEFKYNRPMKYS